MGTVVSGNGYGKRSGWVYVSPTNEEYDTAQEELEIERTESSYPHTFYEIRARFLQAEKVLLVAHIKELRRFEGMTAKEFNAHLDEMEEMYSEHVGTDADAAVIEEASCSGS